MTNNNIRKVLIVGGGTAGWMAAVALSKFFDKTQCEVHLVESDRQPTVGVGESTIPQIVVFNKTVGLNEDEFLKRTRGTFKLGIEFVDWHKLGSRYIHAFGEVGRNMHHVQFYHLWWRMRQQNKADELSAYTLNCMASAQNKFMRSVDAGNSPLSNIAYAFQFDAGHYATFLREKAEAQGAVRTQGHITGVQLNESTGFIESVLLEDGGKLTADLFIDCSGFQGLLIEGALKAGYEDWSHWLPCDSAWAVACKKTEPLLPYTRATARPAGWQWRIPLQHRTGNGHVFSSKFIDNDKARQILLDNLDAEPLSEPRLLRFNTGKRRQLWKKNCVALGLASGFMEPLESTSIHLVQSGISRLMSMFPTRDFDQSIIDEYNRQMDFENRSIRDFLILHYKATERDDTEFWRYCRDMEIPESLAHRISVFEASGTIHRHNNELFNDTSWAEVFFGQGVLPKRYHPLAQGVPQEHLQQRLEQVKAVVARSVDYMPTHQEFIEQHCKAEI